MLALDPSLAGWAYVYDGKAMRQLVKSCAESIKLCASSEASRDGFWKQCCGEVSGNLRLEYWSSGMHEGLERS